jgi:hypothetical protein
MDFEQIPATLAPCMGVELTLTTTDDELIMHSPKWPAVISGHPAWSLKVKIRMGVGDDFEEYTLNQLSVKRNNENCLAHEVGLTIPWDGSSRIVLKMHAADTGEVVSTAYYRNVKPNTRLHL